MDNTFAFDELNGEIGADDWLIPGNELTRRRLIKRTPRYNIYKADWFGDVLVYEPTKQETLRRYKRHQSLATRRKIVQNQHEYLEQSTDTKFNQLVLEIHESGPSRRANNFPMDSSQPSPTFSCDSIQIDSGYSSPSSTPQYNTKYANEFEFPSSSSSSSSSFTTTSLSLPEQPDEVTSTNTPTIKVCPIETSRKLDERMLSPGRMSSPMVRRPVVLNKDSFEFSLCGQLNADKNINELDNYEENDNNNLVETTANNNSEMVWFELNELRLVAHEGFMLFMGASMDLAQVESDHYASLVMQMSHPRAVSLFNLLHANNNLQSSPVDR